VVVNEPTGSNGSSARAERRERADGLLTTGDMARLTGNTLRTVRFYEEAGILRPDRRSAGGHRLFSRRELDRLQFITDMRAAGLSLDEIKSLLELKVSAETGSEAASAALGAIDQQIGSLEQKVELFTRLTAELKDARRILTECRSCNNARCFPDACDECEVVSEGGVLPQSMRVLWAVEGDTPDA
jgi:MerR family Zn(II)-responsive transcriptional regulator of zntA